MMLLYEKGQQLTVVHCIFALQRHMYSTYAVQLVGDLHGGFNVHSTNKPILCDTQGNLHKGSLYDLLGYWPTFCLNLFIQPYLCHIELLVILTASCWYTGNELAVSMVGHYVSKLRLKH